MTPDRIEQRSNLLTLRKQKNGNLLLVPTAEGIEAAKEHLQARQDDHASSAPDSQLFDMLECFLCNGWQTVPPETIGALTDALIISEDGTVPDDGGWAPVVEHAVVYAHMNYMVEDPIETWAEGRTVTFRGSTLERKA